MRWSHRNACGPFPARACARRAMRQDTQGRGRPAREFRLPPVSPAAAHGQQPPARTSRRSAPRAERIRQIRSARLRWEDSRASAPPQAAAWAAARRAPESRGAGLPCRSSGRSLDRPSMGPHPPAVIIAPSAARAATFEPVPASTSTPRPPLKSRVERNLHIADDDELAAHPPRELAAQPIRYQRHGIARCADAGAIHFAHSHAGCSLQLGQQSG